MPYLCYPRTMVRSIIKTGVVFLNAFGSADRTDKGMSARNIIENLPHVDHNHLKHEFGEYVQLHVTEPITNTMKSRTIGAIVLDPRNVTGRYNYMSLETGKQIDGRVTTKSPITDAVIKRVQQLGLDQHQPYRQSKMLKYEWRPGHPIAADDTVMNAGPNENPVFIPEPIMANLPDAGPNPFVPIDVDALPGAEENEMAVPPNDQQEQGPENQGAENEGAQVEAQAEDQVAQAQVEAQAEDQGAHVNEQPNQDVVNENEDIEGDDFPENGAAEDDNDDPDAKPEDDVADEISG